MNHDAHKVDSTGEGEIVDSLRSCLLAAITMKDVNKINKSFSASRKKHLLLNERIYLKI